jgi:uncharacterized membrane protein (UPF0127 family)
MTNLSPYDSPYRVKVAASLTARTVGLLAKGVLQKADVLMLMPCKSIHSFGMPSAIDVAFIAADGQVIKAVRNLPPSRLASCRSAATTLERFSDPSKEWFTEGQHLKLKLAENELTVSAC